MRDTASAMLDVRMLYSALVDADFLDTDAHFQGKEWPLDERLLHGPRLDPTRALAILAEHVKNVARSSRASEAVKRIRADVLEACLAAGRLPQGLWTLSAPTGSGKTLAMLAFALQHAVEHNLRRVVMVIPYLTIIEQTAGVYRGILSPQFGEQYIREHHSLAGTRNEPEPRPASDLDGDNEAYRRPRSLADNWNAPIIVTTSVQFLESLFSNRPSACRKLHRLAQSVILFDEVQTIPDHLAVPTLATLSRLAQRYKATIVFSTATQPAFPHLDGAVGAIGDAGWQPSEIAPPALALFDRARRTQVTWPDLDRPTPWAEIAAELSESDVLQALCIVNIKAHARDLATALKNRGVEGVLHLSTAMCPAHRRAVLRLVRRRLSAGLSCRLVSTQCVEAGVDVDFPTVYRALGPLEAIAQAAGRCNRNGKSACGKVKVFLPEDDALPPGGGYKQATAVTRMLLGTHDENMDIDDPSLFDRYYRLFYDIARPEEKRRELSEAIVRQDFAEVARLYRVIDENTITVVVPYKPRPYGELVSGARANGLTAAWIRRAQPYAVSVFRPPDVHPIWTCLERVRVGRKAHSDEWFIYTCLDDYDRSLGLMPREAPALWLVS
jgi:CRISPR-associated endonuclease/helicase Cas3